MFEEFYYVPFPECQKYEEMEDFEDVSVPTEDGAYFITKAWVDSIEDGSYYERQ